MPALNDHRAMSEKTYNMHNIFLKILTIHALLPLSLVGAVTCVTLSIVGVHHPEIESMVFVLGMVPAVVNPAITVWFMKPYRHTKTMLVHYVHIPMMSVGFISSILLLLSIARATPQSSKNYAILLFWAASIDLLAICADIMSMERLTVRMPSVVFIAIGPCTRISTDVCNYCNSLFCVTMIQSLILQCISFWYRARVLHKPPPAVLPLNLVVIASTIPNIVHMIVFKQMKDYDPVLLDAVQFLYPDTNWSGAHLYGVVSLTSTIPNLTFGYFFLITSILLCYLIIMRSRVSDVVTQLKIRRSISEKTYQMHHIFLKILTIHALLPLSTSGAVVLSALFIIGFHGPELESLNFTLAIFPACVGPAITMWYMKPYRVYVVLASLFFTEKMSAINGSGKSFLHQV
ncbi:hypothetical protein PFISCL1PPCAC_3327 [Pristionchus fissidentatus]|uniref:G protein-coupled receptor n=1 Tax=Pristionchus fissidentatus TaxID=1538716 RepID=A0AAV5UXM0_9BILA|nr:hypothetical protein PFISCL1PPCAC_3327 [Pristionchus fissidentatus]